MSDCCVLRFGGEAVAIGKNRVFRINVLLLLLLLQKPALLSANLALVRMNESRFVIHITIRLHIPDKKIIVI